MHDATSPPPGFAPAQLVLMSDAHTFPIAATLVSPVWQGSESSLKCSLMQALMRPPPGCTPAQCDLISAAQAWAIARCCAFAPVADRRMIDPTKNRYSMTIPF